MEFEATIRIQQQAFDKAQTNNDDEATARLLTDNVRLVGPAGFVLDKAQTTNRFSAGGLRYASYSTTDLIIAPYGDTAIVWGIVNQEGTFQGNPVNGRFRVTEVWVNTGDMWQLAAWHASPLGAPPAFLRQQLDKEASA